MQQCLYNLLRIASVYGVLLLECSYWPNAVLNDMCERALASLYDCLNNNPYYVVVIAM